MIDDAIFALLSADTAVSALVGTRIYPVRLPTNPMLPAIRYFSVGGPSDQTFDTHGLQKPRYQFDCFGATAKDARLVEAAITEVLDGVIGRTVGGVFVQGGMQIDEPVDFDEPDALQFRRMSEFYLFYN